MQIGQILLNVLQHATGYKPCTHLPWSQLLPPGAQCSCAAEPGYRSAAHLLKLSGSGPSSWLSATDRNLRLAMPPSCPHEGIVPASCRAGISFRH